MLKKENLMKLSAFLAAVLNNKFNLYDIYYPSELEQVFSDCKDRYGWYRENRIMTRVAVYNIAHESLDEEVTEIPHFDASNKEVMEFAEKMEHLKEAKEHETFVFSDWPNYVWVIEEWHYLVRKLLHSYLYEFNKLMEDKWNNPEYLEAVQLYEVLKDTLKGWDDFIIENQIPYVSVKVD